MIVRRKVGRSDDWTPRTQQKKNKEKKWTSKGLEMEQQRIDREKKTTGKGKKHFFFIKY